MALLLPAAAQAFEGCLAFDLEDGDFRARLAEQIVGRTPLEYHAASQPILLRTVAEGDAFLPSAVRGEHGRVVAIPRSFARVVCQIALGYYMLNEGVGEEAYGRSLSATASCLDEGGSERDCLIRMGADLQSLYQDSFNRLSERHRRTAYTIAHDTLYLVLTHEYAHHLLGHLTQEPPGDRTLTEFEADLFAVLTAVQNGRAGIALAYLFDPLKVVEAEAGLVDRRDGDNAACRAANAIGLEGAFSTHQVTLFRMASGSYGDVEAGHLPRLLAKIEEHFETWSAEAWTQPCDPALRSSLEDIYGEFRNLYQRVDRDRELLLTTVEDPDEARMEALVVDLFRMARTYEHLGTMAATVASLVVHNWGLRGYELGFLSDTLDEFLGDPVIGNRMTSGGYGRLLQSHALIIAQQRQDMEPRLRLERSYIGFQRAVFYNPALTESWMNLAFVAFKWGDCAEAAHFARRSVETANEPETSEVFLGLLERFAADAELCRQKAAEFHPYPGW